MTDRERLSVEFKRLINETKSLDRLKFASLLYVHRWINHSDDEDLAGWNMLIDDEEIFWLYRDLPDERVVDLVVITARSICIRRFIWESAEHKSANYTSGLLTIVLSANFPHEPIKEPSYASPEERFERY